MRPMEKSAVWRPKLTESIRPPPLARLLKRRTVPPLALRLKPVLVAEVGELLSQLISSEPPADIVAPAPKTNLRGVLGSLLRLASARLTELVVGLNRIGKSSPKGLEMEKTP